MMETSPEILYYRALLLAATNVSIISSNADGLISLFNRGAQDMLGFSLEEIQHKKKLEDLFHPSEIEDRRHFLVPFKPRNFQDLLIEYSNRFGNSQNSGVCEWTFLRKDGEQVSILLAISPVYDDEMRIVGYILIAQNITDQKRIEEELRVANVMLEYEKGILLKYFSRDVVDQIMAGNIKDEPGGKIVQASIMFVDLENSTGMAEELSTDDFVEYISHILEAATNIVLHNSGTVIRTTGDGILATFGCPKSFDDDTMNCLRCAVEFREFMKNFNDHRPSYLKATVGFGIGIASGKIFAGNIGSGRKLEYNVIGDAVNIAARLERLSKDVPEYILIDGETEEIARDRIIVKKRETESIKGKKKQVDVYTLIDLAPGQAFEPEVKKTF